jgi:hypothetical protein
MACSYGHSKELKLHKNGAFPEEPSNCKRLRTLVSGGEAICINNCISVGYCRLALHSDTISILFYSSIKLLYHSNSEAFVPTELF